MLAALQLGHAVMGEARHAAPHHHIAMPHQKALHRIATLWTTKLEGGQQTQRYRDNRVRIVSLVPILVQCQPAAWRIAVDQARIWHETGIAGPIRGTAPSWPASSSTA